jgi:phosphosulfolactate phosphohydrolase-like enzyme
MPADAVLSPPVDAGPTIDVQTQMAIDYYHARSVDAATFLETLRTSRGGQNLLRLGLHADIERAAQGDLFDLVPEWQPAENRIVPALRPVI